MKDHDRYADPKYRYGSSSRGEGRTADTDRCRWEVIRYIGQWPHPGQCSFKHKPNSLWCKKHNPDEMTARQKAQDIRWENSWQKRRLEIHGRAFYDALKKITEDNLNDPAGYAQMILDEFNERS